MNYPFSMRYRAKSLSIAAIQKLRNFCNYCNNKKNNSNKRVLAQSEVLRELRMLLYSGKVLQMFVTLRVTRIFSQQYFIR